MKIALLISIIFYLFLSCEIKQQPSVNKTGNIFKYEQKTEAANKLSKSDRLIKEAINAHGGELYNTANYSFVLRKRRYEINNNSFSYSVDYENDSGDKIKDVLTGSSFTRTINNNKTVLTKEDKSKYSQSLNSVIYFALLPYKLNDASVNKKYIKEAVIKGENYDVVEVTFNQDGGGEDHEDEYYYWINKKDHKIDYFAYNYRVNGGGARFRSAFNRKVVDGITFQDYINWEVSFETPLEDIPNLYENNKLKEVSRIELENIERLK